MTARFDKALFYSSVLSRALSPRTHDLDLTARALATTALVIGAGGGEDEAIAALLLELADSARDRRLLSEIGVLFGGEVAAILQDCLQSDYRKTAAVWKYGGPRGTVSQAPRSALVALADSIVMALALHSDLMTRGAQAWSGYEGSRENVLGHFEWLVQSFAALRPGVLATHFATLVSELICAASPYSDDPLGCDEPLPFRPRIVSDDD